MHPAAFDEDTGFLDAPPGCQDVAPLSIWQGTNELGTPIVISCWKPDAAELLEIARTGRVWLVVMGRTMAPAQVEGFSPFDIARDELKPHPPRN